MKKIHHQGKIKSSWALCIFLIAVGLLPAKANTWKTLENMSSSDLAIFDSRQETARDPNFPYMPAERYPYAAPYTAEEMGYRASEFPQMSRWDHTRASVYGFITSTGFADTGIMNTRVRQNGRDGFVGYLEDTGVSEPAADWIGFGRFPPVFEKFQQIWTIKRVGPTSPEKLEVNLYIPELRKVRKMPPPIRDERFAKGAITFDDSVGRDPWEQKWELIGTDVLYETVRYPNTRKTVTFNLDGKGFVDRAPSSIKLMGDSYQHYTEKDGVKCWVLKATIDPEWLPNYKEKYLLYWLEKTTFFPLRMEKYDHDGKLMMVEVRHAEKKNEALGEFGYMSRAVINWEIQQDLIGMNTQDSHIVENWTKEEEAYFFSAEFMLREWLITPLKSQLMPKGPRDFYMRPLLHPEKFPNHRNIEIPTHVARRYQAQEKAGHLVFDER